MEWYDKALSPETKRTLGMNSQDDKHKETINDAAQVLAQLEKKKRSEMIAYFLERLEKYDPFLNVHYDVETELADFLKVRPF